jgi:hypothetical protein
VAVHTVKLRMIYKENTKVFVGNMLGKEFVIKEDMLPQERKDFSFTRILNEK